MLIAGKFSICGKAERIGEPGKKDAGRWVMLWAELGTKGAAPNGYIMMILPLDWP